MGFFTDEELEEYYGVSVEEISPTDTPLAEYMCGGECYECELCGSMLQVTCKSPGSDTIQGFTEFAYCSSCEVLYERNREPVIDDKDYLNPQRRIDEREEYVCSTCHTRHCFTVPRGGFKHIEVPQIHSYEDITLGCKCGETILMKNGDLPSEISCSKCSRVFTFSVSKES